MEEERFVIFTTGTVGAFVFFIVALIFNGLEYMMSIIETIVGVAIIIEAVIGLLFLIFTIFSRYHTYKLIDIIFSIMSTIAFIISTRILGNGLLVYSCPNPGFGDIIEFVIIAVIVGFPWCMSCTFWFEAINGAREGEGAITYFLFEIGFIILLYLIIYVW